MHTYAAFVYPDTTTVYILGPASDSKYLSTELSTLTLVRWCQNRQIMSCQGIQLQLRRNGGAMELSIRMTRKDIEAQMPSQEV